MPFASDELRPYNWGPRKLYHMLKCIHCGNMFKCADKNIHICMTCWDKKIDYKSNK